MKRTIVLILSILVLFLIPQVTHSNEHLTVRIAGQDRYETSVTLSQINYPDGAERVYIANGDTMVDALTAGPAVDGPILLVQRDRVPDSVLNEVGRLSPIQVIILGGEQAVSKHVEQVINSGRQVSNASSYNEYALSLINQERSKQLYESQDTHDVALNWSKQMASERRLYHNPDYAQQICCYTAVAENIGYSTLQDNSEQEIHTTLDRMHAAFMASSGHNANITNERYDDIGIGIHVQQDSCPNGIAERYCIWVTQDFRERA